MKKLLLLITAILALIPPLRAEEVKVTMFDNSITSSTYPNIPVSYVTGVGANMKLTTVSFNYATASYSNIKTLKYIDSANLDEVVCENTNWNMSSTATIAYSKPSGYSYKALVWAKNTHLKFYSTFGKVKSVTVTFSTTVAKLQVRTDAGTTMTSGTGSSVATYKFTSDTGVISFYHTLTSNNYLKKIEVTYEPGVAVAPDAPTLNITPGYGYEYDKANATLKIPYFPATSTKASYLTPPATNAADKVFYTFNKDLEKPEVMPTGGTSLTNWVDGTAVGIKYADVIPTDAKLAETEFTLRAISYSSATGMFSDILETHCKTVRLEAKIDVDKTIAAKDGQGYDETEGVVTYTTNNPKVFILPSLPGATTYYTTDLSDPANKNNTARKQYSPTSGIIVLNWETGDEELANDTRNKIKLYTTIVNGEKATGQSSAYTYYTTAGNNAYTYTVKKVAAAVPVAPVVNGYTADGGLTLPFDAAKTVRIKETVGFNLGIGGQVEIYEKYFDHEPTKEDLSNTSDFTKAVVETDKGDLLTVTKDKIDIANGKTDCWLVLLSHNSTGYSQPTVIHIALQGPADPSLRPLYGYIQEKDEFTILPSAFRSLLEVDDNTTVVKYQFLKEVNGVTPSAPDPSQWELLDITSGSTDFDSEKITGNGRLFLIAQAPLEGNASAMTSSDYVYYDFTTV